MADSDMLQMNIKHLARSLAVARSRERARCRRIVQDAIDQAYGEGSPQHTIALLTILLDQIGEVTQPIEIASPTVLAPGTPEYDAETERREHDGWPVVTEPVSELPPVHHLDDLAEGKAMIRVGSGRSYFRD